AWPRLGRKRRAGSLPRDHLAEQRLAQRQREAEGRAASRRAIDPDCAAVQLDELPRQREPQPGALGLARRVLADLTELLEQLRLIVGRDADARVLDRDLDLVGVEHGADVDLAALRRELHRV